MSYDELSEIDILKSEIASLKDTLNKVRVAKTSPDDARAQIAAFCQSKGARDMFMKGDPGMEEKNIYHNNVGGASGGGGAEGGCCVTS